MTVIFTDHAAWRAAERHGSSVCLDRLEAEIGAALQGGWGSEPMRNGSLVVTIRGGESFVVMPYPDRVIVLTALGRKTGTY